VQPKPLALGLPSYLCSPPSRDGKKLFRAGWQNRAENGAFFTTREKYPAGPFLPFFFARSCHSHAQLRWGPSRVWQVGVPTFFIYNIGSIWRSMNDWNHENGSVNPPPPFRHGTPRVGRPTHAHSFFTGETGEGPIGFTNNLRLTVVTPETTVTQEKARPRPKRVEDGKNLDNVSA